MNCIRLSHVCHRVTHMSSIISHRHQLVVIEIRYRIADHLRRLTFAKMVTD